MVMGFLGKLEADDNGDANVVTPSAATSDQKPTRKVSEPQDRRLLTMPTDGWIGGPGRASQLPSKFALARG